MILQIVILPGYLEEFLNNRLGDGCTILSIEIKQHEWYVKYDDNEPVCRVCEGPCEDPEVGICDSCSDEPSVRIGRFL